MLAAARACFLAKGFDGTTIEGVAEQAGVAKATVYLRHKDKTALFRAVLAERMVEWGAASRRAAWIKGNTLESRLKHYATAVLRAIRNPEVRAFIKLVDGCRGSWEAIAREFHDMLRANMLRRLSGAIAEFGNEKAWQRAIRSKQRPCSSPCSAHFQAEAENADEPPQQGTEGSEPRGIYYSSTVSTPRSFYRQHALRSTNLEGSSEWPSNEDEV